MARTALRPPPALADALDAARADALDLLEEGRASRQ